MTDSSAAKRYARALFATAKKQDVVMPVEEDLNGFAAAMRSSADMREFLLGPIASQEDKIQLLERVFSDRVTALTMGFLRLIVDKRREELMERIRIEYRNLRRDDEGVLRTIVTSAYTLNEQERTAIVTKIEQETGKRLEPEFEVDKSLIAGVQVSYDDYVLDGSARGALDKLRDRLLYNLLKQT